MSFYHVNPSQQREFINNKCWVSDNEYFKKVHISCLALTKMLSHAESGGNIEVMGLLQGHAADNELVILNVFELPVVGYLG